MKIRIYEIGLGQMGAPMTALYQEFLLSAGRRSWKNMDATSVMRIYGEVP